MKNNHIIYFLVGIFGGILMFLVLGLVTIPNIFPPHQIVTPTSAQNHLPYVVALETTIVRQPATATPVVPTHTTAPPASTPIATHPTSTLLPLVNQQRVESIGLTVEGRSLQVYTFGTGEHERMIVAGIHGGDEWNTVTLANQLIEYLNRNPDTIPEDVTLYILPNLNPDGEERAHNKYGRVNHNNVDLNRNFPVNWKQEWERAGCWNYLPTTSGSEPGSESETKALIDFIEKHKIEALISYHSAALGIFPGGYPWDEKSVALAQSIKDVTSYPYPPIDTGCTYSGTLADYAVSQGIAAVDLELTNHFDTDFDQNLNALIVLMNFLK